MMLEKRLKEEASLSQAGSYTHELVWLKIKGWDFCLFHDGTPKIIHPRLGCHMIMDVHNGCTYVQRHRWNGTPTSALMLKDRR